MWARRATRLYFIDPSLLSPDELEWIGYLLETQYRFRQAIWSLKHYLVLRTDREGTDPVMVGWKARIANRRRLDEAYLACVCLLELHRPATMSSFDATFWLELAFWRRPQTPCTWIATSLQTASLLDQLEHVDWEEPI